jgi:hypothetical protein
MKKLFLPILFLAILITAGAGCVGQTNDDRIVVGGNTPTEMFKAVIADPIHKCIVCKKIFKTRQIMFQHYRFHVFGDEMEECEKCG